MSVFEHAEFDNHESLHHFYDETSGLKAIIAVHLQGCPADLDPILDIARRHNLRVLEDCAQCLGGRYKGKYVGAIGDIGINSFQLSKSITSGEGGAVVTNDPTLMERAMRFHDVGIALEPARPREIVCQDF